MSDLTNSGGYIVRRMLDVDENYTTIPNAYLRDRRLSYKARGILGDLLSHKEGRKVSLKELAGSPDDERDNAEGIAAVRTGVNELERFGYLVRENQKARDSGKYYTVWALTDPTAPLFEMPKKTASQNRTRPDLPFDNRTATASDNRTNKETYLRNLSKETAQAGHSTGEREIEAQRAQPFPVAVAPMASGPENDASGGSLLDADASERYRAHVAQNLADGTTTSRTFDMKASLRRAVEPVDHEMPTPCPKHKFMPCFPNPKTGICPSCGTNYNTGEVAS
ncbi:hypothetical protein [Agreia sp. VKM Ac-1783]|uniref:hypothetical protein n=1 Tax=Agreia sp. VKM Ac-1783 TaxID=1938889 RepID=UPI000A2ABD82|nr:hypothetical protein [Agreia sp. VKM Ac-1783]SMQ73505.1 hypothetical protein SAMN06295943_2899 [Agreia sp. VKM Ac-1783]